MISLNLAKPQRARYAKLPEEKKHATQRQAEHSCLAIFLTAVGTYFRIFIFHKNAE